MVRIRKTTSVIAVLIAASTLPAAAEAISLICDVQSAGGSNDRYVIRIENPPSLLGERKAKLIGTNVHDLKIFKYDEVSMILNLTTRTSSWPDGATIQEFRINRVTGEIEVSFLRPPTEKE